MTIDQYRLRIRQLRRKLRKSMAECGLATIDNYTVKKVESKIVDKVA